MGFPALFALVVDKEATVVDVWDDSEMEGVKSLLP